MNLEDRIKEQFPVLIVTLLSVLIGIDFSDLVGMIRTRMTVWPLDLATLRTWGQILTMTSCSLTVWVIFAHMNVSRLRIPTLGDSIVVFTMPLAIFIGNSFVGQKEFWPWCYWASAYLLNAIVTWRWQVRIALQETELENFSRLTHPMRAMAVVYFGVPLYAAIGWAGSRGWLSPILEMLVALSGGAASMFQAWLFVREWHKGIRIARAH